MSKWGPWVGGGGVMELFVVSVEIDGDILLTANHYCTCDHWYSSVRLQPQQTCHWKPVTGGAEI